MGTAVARPMDRGSAARLGRRLEIVTIAWGSMEAGIALLAAIRGHSIALAAFGLDSVIEVISASALIWRMSHEMNPHRRHNAEHISLRIAGFCLAGLGVYVLADSVWSLLHHVHGQVTWLGVGITAAALICMPILSRAKKRVGRELHSNAMMTDARQTDFCSYQAAIVLVGLMLQSAFGWYWADGVAGLLLAPILFREAMLSFQGKSCCSH